MRKVIIPILLGLFLPVVSMAANPILEKMNKASGAEVVFTETELNSFFTKELSSFKGGSFAKDLYVDIKEEGVSISAQLIKPFKGKLLVEGSVTLKEGKLIPKIKYVRYGWFRMPMRFAEIIGNYALGKNNSESWFIVPGMTWQKFEFRDGGVVVQLVEDVSR
jgi:hypothetical protein